MNGTEFTYCILLPSVVSVPCQHDVGRPEVADGGGGLQLCRVAAHILNKQAKIADEG
jgi:hypothetical protein